MVFGQVGNTCSMKKKYPVILLCFLFLLPLGACHGDFSRSPGESAPSRTYLIYMNGSDLETEYGAATEDLEEILAAETRENSRIFVQTGGTKQWHNELVSPQFVERYEIAGGQMKKLTSLPNESMGKASTLADFITWGVQEGKSEENYLILWNHGGGAVTGFGKDEKHFKDTLLLSELKTAFADAFRKTGIELDYVAFDACLMASLETMNALQPYARYFVGSEELVPSFGFDYTAYFSREKDAADGREAALLLAKTYYNSVYNSAARDNFTISVVDMQRLPAVMDSFEACIPLIPNEFLQEPPSKISNSLSGVLAFGGKSEREGYSNMVDLTGFFKETAKRSPEMEDLADSVAAAVIYKKNGLTSRGACGISIYFPKYLTENVPNELSLYRGLSFSDVYSDTLLSFAAKQAGANPQDLTAWEKLTIDGKSYRAQKIGESTWYEIYTAPGEDGNYATSYRILRNRFTQNAHINAITQTVQTKYGKTDEKYLLPSKRK